MSTLYSKMSGTMDSDDDDINMMYFYNYYKSKCKGKNINVRESVGYMTYSRKEPTMENSTD